MPADQRWTGKAERRRARWALGEEIEEENAEAALLSDGVEEGRRGESEVSGGRGDSSR